MNQQHPLDKSGHRVRDMFAQIAPRYDLLNHLLSMGIDIRWRKQVVRMLELDSDLPVLDCCTGTGDLAFMLAERLSGRAEVIGTDFCEEMLDIARRKHGEKFSGLAVQFQVADAQQLPFPDHTFQAVTVAFGLRNVQDTDQGLREMVRVCAPGGQICVLEFSRPSLPVFRGVYDFYFKRILPRIGQTLANNENQAYSYLPASVQQFPCGVELAKKIESHGVKDVCVKPLTFGVASIYLGRRSG